MKENPASMPKESPAREERPRYEPPRLQALTEAEILNTFQVTQAMQTWWVAGC